MQILSRCWGFLIIPLLFLIPSASAFQIQPVGTEYDQKLAQLDESKAERLLAKIADRGAAIFLEPIHEEITQRIYGCNDSWADKASCAKKQFAPKAVIDGARWNDNPPFMVMDVGIVLKRIYEEGNGEWEAVKQYLDECVYVLKNPDAEAYAGNFEAD